MNIPVAREVNLFVCLLSPMVCWVCGTPKLSLKGQLSSRDKFRLWVCNGCLPGAQGTVCACTCNRPATNNQFTNRSTNNNQTAGPVQPQCHCCAQHPDAGSGRRQHARVLHVRFACQGSIIVFMRACSRQHTTFAYKTLGLFPGAHAVKLGLHSPEPNLKMLLFLQ